jgi:hypothetical protein
MEQEHLQMIIAELSRLKVDPQTCVLCLEKEKGIKVISLIQAELDEKTYAKFETGVAAWQNYPILQEVEIHGVENHTEHHLSLEVVIAALRNTTLALV